MSSFPGSDIYNTVKKVQRTSGAGPAYNKAPMGPVGPQGVVTPVRSRGGRAAKVAPKAAKKNPNGPAATPGTTDITPTPTPAQLTPEDLALQTPQVPNNPGYGGVGAGGTGLASQFNPTAYAKGMAGQQYDPSIVSMATRIKGIINALPGSLDSLHKAFANLDAQAAAPPSVAPVGSGTAATNAYAAQTANIENTAATSQARSSASREADWAERIKLLSSANVNDLRGQLAGLNQQKQDAYAGYYGQGLKTKSDLVSQAISNINSIRASNDAEALTKGNLTGQGLKNQAQYLANQGQALQNQYAPYQESQGLATGAQGLEAGSINISQARQQLQNNAPKKSLANALSVGGPQANQALLSMIIPSGGLTQNANGYTHVMGDPNTWLNKGVAQIMRTLPNSKRANVVSFVRDQISQAISPAGGWTQKNGRFVRPK